MSECKLLTLVWELTMGCNLRCRHCGSACRDRLAGELNEAEALDVARQIIKMKPKWVALSGGEPLLRSDWDTIAKLLTQNGVEVRMVSNGTMITPEVAERIRNSGISLVSISVDGTEEIHDDIRGCGIYQKVLAAFRNLRNSGVSIGVNTTLMKDNISLLEELYQTFTEYGVCSWQLQPGIPEGRLTDHKEFVLDADEIRQAIDFAYSKNQLSRIKIFLAETIGYFTKKEIVARMLAIGAEKPVFFQGCNAGIRSLGILHNGDVVGCTSIRKRGFVEGNLREKQLSDIWNDPNSFAWRRNLQVSDLGEQCQRCKYVKVCMGGCSNIRLSMNGRLNSNNPMCLYSVSLNEK